VVVGVAVRVTVAVPVVMAVPVTVAVAVVMAVPVTVAVAVVMAVPVTVAVAVVMGTVWPVLVIGAVPVVLPMFGGVRLIVSHDTLASAGDVAGGGDQIRYDRLPDEVEHHAVNEYLNDHRQHHRCD
jgi:hypothetical protein